MNIYIVFMNNNVKQFVVICATTSTPASDQSWAFRRFNELNGNI